MDVRNNTISKTVAEISDKDIVTAYKEAIEWKETGILMSGDCKIKDIDNIIKEKIGWEGTHYRETEDAILIEAGRRFCNLIESKNANVYLKRGTKVYYVDFDTSEIEAGTIFSVAFKNGKLDSFSVDFDCGDFDEFIGDALGNNFFLSEDEAKYALVNHTQGYC